MRYRKRERQSRKTERRMTALLFSILLAIHLTACSGEAAKPIVTATGTVATEEKAAPLSEGLEMAVHILDVGQGLAILVQSDGEYLIYDGGDRSASSFVVSYLQQQGITKIDYLISSHYDEDHLAGLLGCFYAFETEQVIGADYQHDSRLYASFTEAVAAQGMEILHPSVGTRFSLGTGSFTILAPSKVSQDSNNNSVAVRVEHGDVSFVFTGDAEYDSESAMCASGLELECDVLVPGHHGSATATSWEFLSEAVPEVVVISCGEDNRYGHPDKDTMDKLEIMEIPVFRTDKQGTIVALSDGRRITWNKQPCNDYSSGDLEDQGTQPQTGGANTGRSETKAAAERAEVQAQSESEIVWCAASGKKYHSIPNCGLMNPEKARRVSRSDAEKQGYEACKKCFELLN